jgi:hypothetical protein
VTVVVKLVKVSIERTNFRWQTYTHFFVVVTS